MEVRSEGTEWERVEPTHVHLDAESGGVDERAAIRADIRETRERMSQTLDEIGERLNANRLKTQVRENIREATIGRVQHMARNAADRVGNSGYSLMDTIRDNPIPAAMVGIGLGWLLVGSRRDDARAKPYPGASYATGYHGDLSATTPRLIQDDAAGGIGASISDHSGHDHGVGGIGDRIGGVREGAMNAASGVAERTAEVAGAVRERTADAASSVAERTRMMASGVAGRTRDIAGSVRERTSTGVDRAHTRFDEALDMNPLAVGAAAIALGVVAGFAIPSTRREDEMLGETRDRLFDQARGRIDEVREKASRVAREVANEAGAMAKDAARENGLMGDSGSGSEPDLRGSDLGATGSSGTGGSGVML